MMADFERSDPLLDYAFQVLYEITYSPGQFTNLCDQLVTNLNSWPALDESMLQILVDEIVALVIISFISSTPFKYIDLNRTFQGHS